MSVAWVAVGATVVGAAGAYKSSQKASASSAAELQFAQQRHDEGKAYLTGNLADSAGAFDKAVSTLTSYNAGGCSAASLATAYNATAYDMQAFMATAYETELDGFLAAFKEAEDVNSLSMDTFNRRYGQIMDNVKRSILDVSQERLAASGREQLALDARILSSSFDNQLVKRGMDRSGISVDMHKRMAMDTAKLSRENDVNSYSQANALQAQGINSLGSMTAAREGIAAREDAAAQNKAKGLLNASMQDANLNTQVSLQNAQNETLASQINATNKTNVSMANATNQTNVSMTNATNQTQASISAAARASANSLALAQLYSNKWSSAEAAMNNFYSGTSTAVSNAYTNAATAASADAAGYAKLTGALIPTVKNLWDEDK